MNKTNGTVILDEQAHIRQSISDILMTAIGSRLQRREYGSIIPFLIDQPINHQLLLQLSAASVIALKKWEPRINITKFAVIQQESKLIAQIEATTADNKQINMTAGLN